MERERERDRDDRWESRSSYRYDRDPSPSRRRSRSPVRRSTPLRHNAYEQGRFARSASTPLDPTPQVDTTSQRRSIVDDQTPKVEPEPKVTHQEPQAISGEASTDKSTSTDAAAKPIEQSEPVTTTKVSDAPAEGAVTTSTPSTESRAEQAEQKPSPSPEKVQEKAPEQSQAMDIDPPQTEPLAESRAEAMDVDSADKGSPETHDTSPTLESSAPAKTLPRVEAPTLPVIAEEASASVEEQPTRSPPVATITVEESHTVQEVSVKSPQIKSAEAISSEPIVEAATETVAQTATEKVMDTDTEKVSESPTTPTVTTTRKLRIDAAETSPKVTIAERRSVVLPPSGAPIPTRARLPRRDSQPTGGSAMESTDAETDNGPRTADMDASSDTEADPDAKMLRVIGMVKAAQSKPDPLDIDSVLKYNQELGPQESSRVDASLKTTAEADAKIEKIVWPLAQTQAVVGRLVAITVQKRNVQDRGKAERLKEEYLELEAEWKEHCEFLDGLMEKRGPPPGDLYSAPDPFPPIPVTTPGVAPLPSTPMEEPYGSRNRRRGGGDAATTEAEFEAILASLADTAARDPNYRAKKTTAVVPDMLPDHERNQIYDDDNDLVTDPIAFYDFNGDAEPVWTDEERATFQRRYLNYPKQFGKIAETIPNKTASDCVLYYYRTKKTIDYKGMLASRRGDKKKKALPIKKGGKSSALLADLSRSKPTVNASTATGPRSAITPARAREDKRTKNKESGTSTPVAEVPPRRRKGDEDESVGNSAVPSRAGSETPTVAKMRMSAKTPKRPRVSSANDLQYLASAAVDAISASGAPNAPGPPGLPGAIGAPGAPGSVPLAVPPIVPPTEELLPPVKRSGKRRKIVDPADPNALPDENKEKDPSKPRRTATNSYWSVDEKRSIQDLVRKYGANAKAIAAEIPGKSERQVVNFIEAHRTDMHLDDLARLADVVVQQQQGQAPHQQQGPPQSHPFGQTFQQGHSEESKPSGYPQPSYGRSIYDVYQGKRSEMFEHKYAEPRLGMFPPLPPAQPSHPLQRPQPAPQGMYHAPAPIPTPAPLQQHQPISRPGGMRISALLNEDMTSDVRSSIPPPRNDTDAGSDGTVSEREIPSPRPSPSGVYDPAADLAQMRQAAALDTPPSTKAPTPASAISARPAEPQLNIDLDSKSPPINREDTVPTQPPQNP